MEQFTKQELQNIGQLISAAPITGKDSVVVAMLLQKIGRLLAESDKPTEKPAEPKPETAKEK